MREWRAAAGLSRSEAGSLLNLASKTIRDIEQGRSRADDVLAKIALKKMIEDAK
jgi:DNA-binding XRE family transcriptional regulator